MKNPLVLTVTDFHNLRSNNKIKIEKKLKISIVSRTKFPEATEEEIVQLRSAGDTEVLIDDYKKLLKNSKTTEEKIDVLIEFLGLR